MEEGEEGGGRMIWVWIVIAFVVGYTLGLFEAAILSGLFDRAAEERAAKKNEKIRQRGNADGSEKGVSTYEIHKKVYHI